MPERVKARCEATVPQQGKHADEERWSTELRDTISKPPRQEDIRDAAALGSEVLHQIRERTPSAIGREHGHLREGDSEGAARPPWWSVSDARHEDVQDRRGVQQKDRGVDQLDAADGRTPPGRSR